MTEKVVARRYAKALFAVGRKKGDAELQVLGAALSELNALLAESPALARFFRNPVFSSEEKKKVLVKVLEKLSQNETVADFCCLLADKGRLSVLPEIASGYSMLLDEYMGITRGELTTVVDLSVARQDELKNKLEKQTNRKLILKYKTDTEILGGVVLKIGDMVLDASLRAQLQILKENIKRGK